MTVLYKLLDVVLSYIHHLKAISKVKVTLIPNWKIRDLITFGVGF